MVSTPHSLKDAGLTSHENDDKEKNAKMEKLKNKFSDLTHKDNVDMDKLLSDLLISNISHSYHANFKDSIKELTNGDHKRASPKIDVKGNYTVVSINFINL